MRAALAALAAAACAAALLGCGGDDDSGEADVPGGADPEEVQVIDDWANALREGDVEAAAELFAVPSVAQNGGPPLELESRKDVVVFNRSLPCGAELVRAEEQDRFTVATFELTERPGEGECGAGAGVEARTAFVIEDGLITHWIRAADESDPVPPDTGPVV